LRLRSLCSGPFLFHCLQQSVRGAGWAIGARVPSLFSPSAGVGRCLDYTSRGSGRWPSGCRARVWPRCPGASEPTPGARIPGARSQRWPDSSTQFLRSPARRRGLHKQPWLPCRGDNLGLGTRRPRPASNCLLDVY
jgi:hypothetical protein